MVIACLAALSFSRCDAADARWLSSRCTIPTTRRGLNDIGNLMLTFTLLWTYMSFAQFLIIWSGNLKQEIPWYKMRAFGPWAPVAAALLILHFFVPFFILLQRGVKRRLQRLSVLAVWMLVITLVDVYWLIVPSFQQVGSAHSSAGHFCRDRYWRRVGRRVHGAAEEDAAAAAARSAV